MRTAIILALLFGAVVDGNAPTFTSQLKLTRDRPRQLTNDGLIEYYQRAQVERHDKTITVTTWQPFNKTPNDWEYREESVSIDASGWKELIPVIEEAIQQEN